MRADAIFGGALALFVAGVAIWALTRGLGAPAPGPTEPPAPPGEVAQIPDPLCQCFDDGFKLAGSAVGVMSAQYRTGFEQCRARLGTKGGEAWTAGWNARLSSQPWQASCRAYLKGQL